MLNAQAVEWARRAQIVIHARKTSDPVGGGRETVCVERPEGTPVRAIVGLDRVVHARMPARELRASSPRRPRVLEVPGSALAASGEGATCAIPLLNVPDWARCRASLEERARGAAFEPDCAVVSVVGDGLTGAARALPRFLALLDEVGASPRVVNAGPLRIGATIEAAKLADAQRALHAAFVHRGD